MNYPTIRGNEFPGFGSIGALRVWFYRVTFRRVRVAWWRFVYDEHRRLCGQPYMSNGKAAPRP